MANEPRGPRGPKDPTGPDAIAGITARRYSQRQREMLEAMAEQDRWYEARNAYAPGNRPAIFHQLNPLMIPEKYQGLSEFWTVYVPRTSVAWNSQQIERDHRHRVHTTAVNQQSDTETPTPEERARVDAAQRDEARLQQALKNRQVVAFGSADEAERYAQHVWRDYWVKHLPRQSVESRQAFEQNAVINAVRREAFTMDVTDPAHMAQYEVWRAQYPEGLPSEVVVHQRNVAVDIMMGANVPLATPDDDPVLDIEPDRSHWDLARPAVRPEAETPWEVRSIGDNTWVLARQFIPTRTDDKAVTPGPVWEFWRNGTGRAVAFAADGPDKVLHMVPNSIPVVLGAGVGRLAPETLNELWHIAQSHDRQVVRHPAVQEWLIAEQSVGETLKQMMAANPHDAPRLKPVLNAVVQVHRVVMPANGVVSNNPELLEQAYGQLNLTIAHGLPAGAPRDQLVGRVQHWHHKAGPLAQNSLGIFQYDRIPDVAFTDPEAESVARLDGTGDWIAHRTPSGAFVLAKLGPKGTVDRVDLPIYRDAKAARIRVSGQGGYLTFEQHATIADRWRQSAEIAFGPEEADRKWGQLMTPQRVLRQEAYAAAQATDPKPMQLQESTATRPTLYVTPLGGGRALVWQYPANAQRKDQAPEFVVWKNDELVGLNKHSKGWLPERGPNAPKLDWAVIPDEKRPWVVMADGLVDAVQQVAQRVPEAKVEPKQLTDPTLIRALAQRYGLTPEPFQSLKEPLWTVHPTPKGTVMLSTREWVAHEKERYPGEYDVHATAKPYQVAKDDGTRDIAEWPSAAAAKQALEKAHLAHTVSASMPPEVADWFNPKLERSTLATPAVRWGPVDPWTALTRANRFVRESFVDDLAMAQEDVGVPTGVVRMQRQIVAGATRGLTAADFESVLPHVPQETGVTWRDVESQVHDFARLWLEERPKLAERLTQTRPTPRQEPTLRSAAVSL